MLNCNFGVDSNEKTTVDEILNFFDSLDSLVHEKNRSKKMKL